MSLKSSFFTYNKDNEDSLPTIICNHLFLINNPFQINSLNSFNTDDNIKQIENNFNKLNKRDIDEISHFHLEIINQNPIYNIEENKKKENEINFKASKDKKKILGRKRKEDKTEGKNNKFSDNTLRRKCKHIILKNVMKFINDKLYEIYNGKIDQGMHTKKLLMLNQEQIANVNVKYNKLFLNKKIGDIFSENISSTYTNFQKDHNKKLIKELLEEKDEHKRIYFKNLFNLTFLECLKHFRKSETIEELNGFDGYNELIKQYDDDLDYKMCLEFYLQHFEEIIDKKKSRKKKIIKFKKVKEDNN